METWCQRLSGLMLGGSLGALMLNSPNVGVVMGLAAITFQLARMR